MTKDDIIQMAREAGSDDWGIFRDFMPEIERFANLVAAAEREACLQAIGDLIRKHRDEKDGEPEGYPDIFDAVEAIRARGK